MVGEGLAADPPLRLWGLDHHRSPLALRERLALLGEAPQLLAALAEELGADEALLLSTCHRWELYLAGAVERERLEAWLAARSGLPPDAFSAHAFWHEGAACARHLFRVAAGLESAVIGEAEILGQVRRAYELARQCGRCGPLLHGLLQRALACGKAVRSETGIGDHRLSVAALAIDLARQVLGELAGRRALVIGAGENAELAARYAVAAGLRELTIVNRHPERAAALAAQFAARAEPWERLGDLLAEHDLVISSTAAPHPVVSAGAIAAAMQRRRAPLVCLDLAVPRDIEPAAAELDDVFVFTIDHLERMAAEHLDRRRAEASAAAALVESAVSAWRQALDAGRQGLLGELAAYFQEVIAVEEARLAARCPGADRAELRYALERVANKLRHPLLAYARRHADDPERLRWLAELLGLPQRD